MESTAQQLKDIISQTGEMVETKAKLWKLKAIDKGSEVISSVISVVAIVLLISLTLIMLSIGLALIIGQWLGEIYYGFLIMAGVYGLAGLFIFVFRKKFIKGPVSNLIINGILN
jgi:Putative Actinobacterial Holin-X, holin superfamily III